MNLLLLLVLFPSLVTCCDILDGNAVSCEDIKILLDHHNKHRAMVARGEVKEKIEQPPAADMLEMRWDWELADASQEYAIRQGLFCSTNRHSPPSERPNIGENLAYKGTTLHSKSSLESLVQMWYDEVKEPGYDGEHIGGAGHYTQMVWGKSDRLGCGVVLFKHSSWYKTFLVCRYKPAGNWVGRKPYTHGTPNCAALRLHDSITYNGLCTEMTEAEQKNYDPCSASVTMPPFSPVFILLSSFSFVYFLSWSEDIGFSLFIANFILMYMCIKKVNLLMIPSVNIYVSYYMVILNGVG